MCKFLGVCSLVKVKRRFGRLSKTKKRMGKYGAWIV